ncbi:UNVERIFIED_CONTAM: hypothetical protein FKN15_016390 [Acipenser sinensis]
MVESTGVNSVKPSAPAPSKEASGVARFSTLGTEAGWFQVDRTSSKKSGHAGKGWGRGTGACALKADRHGSCAAAQSTCRNLEARSISAMIEHGSVESSAWTRPKSQLLDLSHLLFLMSQGRQEPSWAPGKDWNSRSGVHMYQGDPKFSSLEVVNAHIQDCVPRIEASDRCDPAGLRSEEQPCLLKISRVLHYYSHLFGENSVFNESDFNDLARTLSQLMRQIKSHYGHASENGHGVAVEDWSCITVQVWERPCLQRHYMERLKSFSIIVARVFTPGNPSEHDVTAMPQCATS